MKTTENTIETFISFVDSETAHSNLSSCISRIKMKIRKLMKRYPAFYDNAEITKYYINSLNKIVKYKKALIECAEKIDKIIEDETHMYMDNINTIYWILFSKEQKLDYDSLHKNLTINKRNVEDKPSCLDEISTAQRVCVALSVIFAQFFSATNSPRFILLDETVANFDSIHLLNLLDFLRELVIHNIQIIFTTADENIKNLTQKKLSFLKDDFKIIEVSQQIEEK